MKHGIKGMVVLAAMVSQAATAKDLSIKLDVLEMIHAQEKSGDELYFSVTEFPENKAPRHYRIPSYPTHWMSDHLKNVKNIVLWQRSYPTCEKTDVLISLVEADLPPWNVDDLLGAVEFKVTCEQGQMKTEWKVPNKENTAPILNHDGAFSFTGDHSEYHAIFKLDESKITIKQNIPEEETIKSKPSLRNPEAGKVPILNK
ncbi:MAG: hypothetical protein AB7I18_08115 [Candidatus Berkiella sp.]